MPLFLDRHDGLREITADQIAMLHATDVKYEAKHGVKWVTYFMKDGEDSGSCLVEAPSIEAVIACHTEAHGGIPGRVIEVDWASVGDYLGRVVEPQVGQPWQDSAFRAILYSRLEDASALIQRLGDVRAVEVFR